MIKKIILYYLYTILLVPILERVVFGSLDNVSFHPGIVIHVFILAILIVDFFKNKPKLNKITYMIVGFTLVYIINFFVVESIQFSDVPIGLSISYTLKIFLLLFVAYFVYKHHEYYKKHLNNILLINSIVILLNIILGYTFHLGWQSYKDVVDSYRGYLAGNDTSIFAFMAYGYALFSYSKSTKIYKKIFYIFLMLLSIYSMYLIATKSIFLAGIITFLFSIRNGFKLKTLVIGITIFILGTVSILSIPNVQNRIMKNYLVQKQQTAERLNIEVIPDSLLWLNEIAPGRTVIGLSLFFQLINDNPLNLLFGYGAAGVYKAFGRPPQMHLFSVLGHYGLLGWLVFYLPQLLLAMKVIRKNILTMPTVLFFSIFLYGTLGGFVYGNAATSVVYALFFAFSLREVRFVKARRIKK